MVYVETPANPTNRLIDLTMCKSIAQQYSTDERYVYMAVDNTYMGPVWSHPLETGTDIIMYSATKYIGGHSDVIAGAVLGTYEAMARVKTLRTFLGNMTSPFTGWLLMRSLETLKIRMDQQALGAKELAGFLRTHKKVAKVHYLGFLEEDDKEQFEIFKNNRYTCAGAMISVEVKGGEKEAFALLNNLKLAKLAVSLGSTETLVQHPATMTHAGIDPEEKIQLGIKENMVRISVGVENPADLICDFTQALDKI
jgi:methionine-gamma-lyase